MTLDLLRRFLIPGFTTGGCLIALLCLAGCGKPQDELAVVHGQITLDGQALPRGSVSLRPEKGEQGWDQPTGLIKSDGQFVVYTNGREGAPCGRYRVVVFATDAAKRPDGAAHPGLPASLIPARYNDPQATPLRLEITNPPPSAGYTLELKSHDS